LGSSFIVQALWFISVNEGSQQAEAQE